MSQHIIPVRTNLIVFAILMVLLVATIGAAYLDLGPLNIILALGIAGMKALLIVLYFMHVRFSSRLTWVFSSAAFLWLAILIVISASDYATRDLLQIPGK